MSKNRDFQQWNSNKSEALSNDRVALSTLNVASAANTSEQSGDRDDRAISLIDPALVIGLTLASVKQGHVSAFLLQHLDGLANSGNAACSLVIEWIRRRAAHEPDLRRSIKPLHSTAGTGCRTRSQDPIERSKAEIISASAGGADE